MKFGLLLKFALVSYSLLSKKLVILSSLVKSKLIKFLILSIIISTPSRSFDFERLVRISPFLGLSIK